MDEERREEPAGDPRFIPGIYNYCDQRCERCAFTSGCANYAMSEAESDRPESQDLECILEDANGSAKVALIGIERSMAAWAGLLPHFPDQEHTILNLLATLQRLRRQVETAFPNARVFLRPGFDAEDK